ncbi:MAG: hypothetical protein LOY03_13700 [Cyclobacteriaceae bacterium]|nr:hypothetical protein [Cyclobacteriaceae bacterium]
MRCQRHYLCLALLLLVFPPDESPAQVPNNEISERISIVVNDTPIQSTTAQSTVQPDCIDKKLTAACLVYHNDQWFTFSVPTPGKYYVNFSGQDCLEKRGIQMLLLEGDPCVIQSYRIVECIPRVGTGDTYVVVDSLRPNVPYLMNIDGFLGDQCSFAVQIADHAAGFPHRPTEANSSAEFQLQDSVVTIRISIAPGEMPHYSEIKVYRRYADADESLLMAFQPGRANALGDFQSEYAFRDTLPSIGTYRYRAYAVRNDSRELVFLGERRHVFYGVSSGGQFVPIPAALRTSEEVRVRILHPPDGKTLNEFAAPGQARKVGVDFQRYIKAGYRDFAVEFSAGGQVHVVFYRATSDDYVTRVE